jgi:hypothetical protein
MNLTPSELSELAPLKRGTYFLGGFSFFTFVATTSMLTPTGLGPLMMAITGVLAIDFLKEKSLENFIRKTWGAFLLPSTIAPFFIFPHAPLSGIFLLIMPCVGMSIAWFRHVAGSGWLTPEVSRSYIALMRKRMDF